MMKEAQNETRTAVEVLIRRAALANDSSDAVRLSQAACNVANALRAVKDTSLLGK